MELFFPPFRMDLSSERLWQDQREVRLRPKTFAVLRYLMERPGRLVSTAELLAAVWPDVTVSDVMPRLCVRELRTALGDDVRAPRFIETRPGRGYQFKAPVLPLTMPPAHLSERAAGPATTVRPLVGRAHDLERLAAALTLTRRGLRQIVFVSGEAGIGKTSLIDAFLASSAGRGVLVAKGECVEHYGAGEPYLPILAGIERLCRTAGGDELVPSLQRTAPTWLAQMPSLIEPAEHAALARRVASSTPQRMLRELTSFLEAIAGEQVVVMWLEDLHWADYSTLEAIAAVARRSEAARLMLLGTYRPTELLAPDHPLARTTHELTLHRHGQEIALTRLAEPAVAEYLGGRLAGPPVASALARHVYQRTDGNPLFMITVVDDLIARAQIVERGGQWTLDDASTDRPADVPDALRRLIEQQAQRLPPEDRRLLHVASVAGMEFSAAVVAAALDDDPEVTEARCARLTQLGQFLVSRGAVDWPDGTTASGYAFVHALHQEVLYQAVPAGHRRDLHRRIARRLEQAFAGRLRDVATELAMHVERARDAARAVPYRRMAGEIALARAAHGEAIAHLGRGLEALKTLPDDPARAALEIDLLLGLGPAMIVTRGYAAPEVALTYSRALELARMLGETPPVVRALRGLWNVHLVRAELGTARQLATELLTRARVSRDPALLSFAHAALGETLFHSGELDAARQHLDRALASSRRDRSDTRRSQRPRVASYASWGLWMAGHPNQARRLGSQAVVEARTLGHPHNRAFTLGFAGFLHELCGEASRVAELAEELQHLCREHDIPYWQSWAAMLTGWVLGERGHATEGVAAMRKGLAEHRETGGVVGVVHFLSVLAELLDRAGHIDAGLETVDEALALTVTTGNRYLEAEIYRLRGELLRRAASEVGRSRAASPDNLREAERCLRRAVQLARRRGAKSLELRAATSLGRLWQERAEPGRTRRVLTPIYRWFTEGFDTADLTTARHLLTAVEGPRPASIAGVRTRW